MAVAELTVPRPEPAEGWLNRRRARAIGWTAFGIGSVLRGVQLWLVGHMDAGVVQFTLHIGVPTFLAAIVLGTASSVVGAIIVARRPANVVGWLYVLTGVLQGIITAGLAYAALTMRSRSDAIGPFFAWANGVVDYAVPFSFAAIVLLLFPDGRLVGPRWRWAMLLALVGGLVRELEVGFGERTAVLIAGFPNPYRIEGSVGDALERSSSLGIGSVMVESAFVLSAVSLAVRYRASDLDGRRQIRWIVLAGFIAVLSSIPLVVGTIWPALMPANFDAVGLLFVGLTFAPISTLIAITRYRLYEIDRIVNRALLYGSLTAILAGVFTAGIGLAQRLFILMTGVTSDAAIVLTTLVVATLYAPLRKRLEAIVDRRFKFEARFGAYGHQLEDVLDIVDPELAARRLVREAVAELGADGGAVLAGDGSVIASAGRWPGIIAERIPIDGGVAAMQAIVLTPRPNGQPFAPADLAELRRVAALAARAAGLPRRR